MILGDSSVTVPEYILGEEAAGRDPRACNVLFVDGNHSEDGTYADLTNFRDLASRQGRASGRTISHLFYTETRHVLARLDK